MPRLRVVFAATSSFAVPALKALTADARFSVDLVITQPDRPVGRKQQLTPSPVKVAAMELGLPVWQPENINTEWGHNPKRTMRPDFLVVIAYGQLLKQPVLDYPTVAAVNVHGSLLPRWRGASPVHHAILSGDTEGGVTVQKMVMALDAGPILGQTPTSIDPRETFQTLHDRLADFSAPLLIDTLTKPLDPKDQDETQVTLCRKLARADGVCDPGAMTAEEIDRKVRALTPWPGVTIAGLKVLKTDLTSTSDSAPLPCASETVLHLVTVQEAGKKPVTGAEWARGKKKV